MFDEFYIKSLYPNKQIILSRNAKSLFYIINEIIKAKIKNKDIIIIFDGANIKRGV